MPELKVIGRELAEIKHAMFYSKECGHETVGHNILILVDKMAKILGFTLVIHGETQEHSAYISLHVPETVEVTPNA